MDKKEIILKDKTVNKGPRIIKNNNNVITLYLMLNGDYLFNDKKQKIISNNPLLYKSFDNNLKFLLEPKKQKLIFEIEVIQTFFRENFDLYTYLKRVYTPSEIAKNVLFFAQYKKLQISLKKKIYFQKLQIFLDYYILSSMKI